MAQDHNRDLPARLVGLPKRPTLARFLDFWLAHTAWQQLRFTTARTYASTVLRLVVPVLGEIPVRRLTTANIEHAQVAWQRAGVTPSMRRKAVEVLRSALRHAVALGLCEHNAASRSTVPKKGERAPQWLDRDGARRLLDSVRGHPLESAYALALGLGLRRGEILGLTWDDVDLDERVLRVRWNRIEYSAGTRLAAPKTAASRRALAMPRFLAACLRRQRARELRKASKVGASLHGSDPVLTTRNRRPYWNSYLHSELQLRLRRLAMPRMRYHDLRHTAASLMLAEGISPRTVMEIMGHRNLAVTMLVYGHVNLRHQRLAVAVIDKALE
ncbi:MAG: site-specific integrase [Myxococcales bacterium]